MDYSRAWAEARSLVWAHRRSLGFGLLIMLVNRLSGLVLPGSSKFLIDEVIGNRRADMRAALKAVLADMPDVRRRVTIDVDPLSVL